VAIEDVSTGCGVIRIRRRPTIQDLLRRYAVFIDGAVNGSLSAFQTRSFPVPVGRHTVQLRIVHTGTSRSDEVKVDVKPGQVVSMHTGSMSFKQLAQLPLAFQSPDRFAPRPWIQLALDTHGEPDTR
jgi:hypothetical protein